jgi:hypothetical protein
VSDLDPGNDWGDESYLRWLRHNNLGGRQNSGDRLNLGSHRRHRLGLGLLRHSRNLSRRIYHDGRLDQGRLLGCRRQDHAAFHQLIFRKWEFQVTGFGANSAVFPDEDTRSTDLTFVLLRPDYQRDMIRLDELRV